MADREWEGGYVRKDGRGRDVYYIRRMMRGHRYHVSTRCHAARAALEQLARFEADPTAYDPRGTPSSVPIALDAALVTAFLGWSRDVRHNTRSGSGSSARHWLGGRSRSAAGTCADSRCRG